MDRDPAATGSWTELNRLLDAALSLPQSERLAWLDSLSPEHAALEPRLRSLLMRASQIETDDFLGAMPKIGLTTGEDAALRPVTGSVGDMVGPYRLVRELGSGGMGAVWLAERTDGMLQRQVALKLPHLSLRLANLAERMAHEREILATLEHAHIARLYGAGITADGQPYLALEYVEGIAVDEYCAAHDLDLRHRLKLFLQITSAVAYAHGKLVVHRDLKPKNVLVTAEGEARLLDFGIAKLLERGHTQETQLTQFAGPAFTLEYASPEQIRGEPLGVASDIYSLGVILFRLVTGGRPYRPERETRGALEDAVLKAEPARPSEVVARNLSRAVRGDLDTIILKCLKKEAEQRYATVNALADDIDRHLHDRPVLAQPDSLWYLARKFIRRNAIAAGAAASICVALVAGAGMALWQARVARDEQHRAKEVKEVLADIFRNADPAAGGTHDLTAVQLLNQAQARIERLPAERAALRLELFGVVATSLANLEQYDKAQSVVERMIAEATRAFGAAHIETTRARLELTHIRRVQGRNDGLADELVALLERVRNDPAATSSDLITALHNSAHVAIDETRYEDARRAAEEAMTLATASLPANDPQLIAIAELLSVAIQYNGTPEQAVAAAERTHRLLAGVTPADPLWAHAVEAHFIYGRALADAGRLKEGLALIARARSEASTLFGADSPMVAFTSAFLAKNFVLAGDLSQAVVNSTRALQLFEAQAQPGSFTHGAAYNMHGSVLLESRRVEASLPYLITGADELTQVLGADNDRALAARTDVALALAYSGRFADAARSLDGVLSHLPPPNRNLSYEPRQALGVLKRLQGDYAEAERVHEMALAAVRPGPRFDLHRARVRTELGLDLVSLGRHAEAIEMLRPVIEDGERLFITMSPMQADAFVARGRARLMSGQIAVAQPDLVKADEFWQSFDKENRWAGEAALWRGRCELALGNETEGRKALERARRILARSALPSDRALLGKT